MKINVLNVPHEGDEKSRFSLPIDQWVPISIRNFEAISASLMTPFWGCCGVFGPGVRCRWVGGGMQKAVKAGWGISLTAFIMRALLLMSVLSSKQKALGKTYCDLQSSKF